MKNNDGKTRISGRESVRVNLAVITSLVIVLLMIVMPFFRTYDRDSDSIPLQGVSGLWADSVFMRMSTREKIELILMHRHLAEDFNYSDSTLIKGGISLSFDSLSRYHSFKTSVSRMAAPPLSIIDNPDSIPDNPLMLLKQELLSIRSDSLLELYFRHHLAQIKAAGVSMAIYPLWENRHHSIQLPDTFLARRQESLIRRFVQIALDKGVIPVSLLPEIIKEIANPKNHNDSVLMVSYKNILSGELPAIFIDSIQSNRQYQNSFRQFLKDTFGFYGLIITIRDIRHEKDFFDLINAGADMILSKPLQEKVVQSIISRCNNDKDVRSLINGAAKRILLYREWLQNQAAEPVTPASKSFNETQYLRLLIGLKEAATIRLKDSPGLLPFREVGFLPGYTVYLPSKTDMEEFTNTMGLFADYRIIRYRNGGIINLDRRAINILIVEEGWKPDILYLLQNLSDGMKIVTIHIGQPVSLEDILDLPVVIHAWDKHPITQRHLANTLFGGSSANGVVPFDYSVRIRGGDGLSGTPRIRLNHTMPEAAGIPSRMLNLIDSIITEAIQNGAFPGCQVFIAREGNVIFNRAYGTTTYDSDTAVKLTHLYDLGSVTKVAATTIAFMKMTQTGKMSVDDPIGKFFRNRQSSMEYTVPDTLIRNDTIIVKGSRREREKILSAYKNFESINDTLYIATDTVLFISTRERNVFRIRSGQLLTHRSGLPPALPISGFLSTFDRRAGINRYREIYSPVLIPDSADIMVAEGMYLYRNYFDTLWERVKSIGISPSIQYIYSDANMVFLQQAIDSVNRKPLNIYLREEFYQPLGLRYCLFNPLEVFGRDEMIPTANDIRWRRQQIQGTVHDPTAALFGGIAGNAGLFANAHDLGVLGQMLLDSGSYGGKSFLDPLVVQQFTTKQKTGHRGLGFDIPSPGRGIIATSAPDVTYGHTGFTGTCLWIDPENRIVFVFLSNRIYPNTENQKINFFRVRERVHQVIYDAIESMDVNRVN